MRREGHRPRQILAVVISARRSMPDSQPVLESGLSALRAGAKGRGSCSGCFAGFSRSVLLPVAPASSFASSLSLPLPASLAGTDRGRRILGASVGAVVLAQAAVALMASTGASSVRADRAAARAVLELRATCDVAPVGGVASFGVQVVVLLPILGRRRIVAPRSSGAGADSCVSPRAAPGKETSISAAGGAALVLGFDAGILA